MIDNFNDFNEDLLLESINESMLYFSKRLRSLIDNIDSPIASKLTSVLGTDIKHDVTFVDSDAPVGYVTFNTMSNVMKKTAANWLDQIKHIDKQYDPEIVDNVWNRDDNYGDIKVYLNKSRNSVKIGRLVNRLFPQEFKDKEVEDFVNKYKSQIENLSERFVIVEGDDIAKWYREDTYMKQSGHLGNSCMKNAPADYFNIYTQNPQVCRMLILIENNQLKGRALIWKIENIRVRTDSSTSEVPEFEYFLDRQYTFLDSDVIKFKDYAKEQGWAYKRDRSHNSPFGVMFDGNDYELNMDSTLNAGEYNNFPYVDTLKSFYPYTLIMTNDGKVGAYKLDQIDGTHGTNGVWSEWLEEYVDRDESKWSDYLDTWILEEDSIQLDVGSYRGDYMPSDHDDIRFDKISEEYTLVGEAVWSEYYNHYVYDGYKIQCITSIDNKNILENVDIEMVVQELHKKDKDVVTPTYNRCYRMLRRHYSFPKYILKSLTVKNNLNDYIPELLALEAFKVQGGHDDIRVLTKIDSYLLDIPIDLNKSEVIDSVTYNLDLYRSQLTETQTALDMIDEKSKSFEGQTSMSFDHRTNVGKQNEKFIEDIQNRHKTTFWGRLR